VTAAGLEHYWSGDFRAANALIALNVLGALLLAVALDRAKAVAPSRLAQELASSQDLSRFTVAPVRN